MLIVTVRRNLSGLETFQSDCGGTADNSHKRHSGGDERASQCLCHGIRTFVWPHGAKQKTLLCRADGVGTLPH